MTALISIAVIRVLSIVVILESVLLFKIAARGADALERAHERSNEYTEGLVDRLMAMDFGSFKAYQMAMRPQLGTDDSQPVRGGDVPMERTPGADRGGFGSSLGLRALSDRKSPWEATEEDEEAIREGGDVA